MSQQEAGADYTGNNAEEDTSKHRAATGYPPRPALRAKPATELPSVTGGNVQLSSEREIEDELHQAEGDADDESNTRSHSAPLKGKPGHQRKRGAS
mmetsp:Transcript_24873/g.37346  ORF Transcript_24873/g.37346 Transcript_24873/m.37346 type:complete len:96 (-) Transcript_24873:338-625(-)